MKSISRLIAVTKKEVRQLRRDRLTFGMIVGIPVIQMLLFGYAINTDVRIIGATNEDLPALVPGATARARIDCGRRALGYVWLHDLFEAFQTWVAF